jgi:acetylornithine deacetylase/succinyl-diaminopimelate desuccinylase-like protein
MRQALGTSFKFSILASVMLAACSNATEETDNDAGDQQTVASVDLSSVAEHTKVQQALAAYEGMEEKNVERLITLTEIPAPPFREEKRAEELVRQFEAVGMSDISVDEVGNVLARRKGVGDGRTVAVIAHLDTVFPLSTDVTVRRDGDVLYAPGIGDNTQGLVAMLSLAEALNTYQIETEADILFVGSVGEEGLGDLRGVRHLFREDGPRIDAVVSVDGGGADRLVVDAVGSLRYRVMFSGPGGHSYGAFGLAHPHQALARTITNFTERARPITEDGAKATFSVGRIGGGTSINSIPFTSWMEVDMRSVDQAKLDALNAAFNSSVDDALAAENAARTRGPEITVEVKPVGDRPAGQGDRNAALVQNAMAAMELNGLEARLVASSTDSNIPISKGIPAITMSRGGISRNAHAPNESWEKKDPHIALRILTLTVLFETGVR